MHRVEISLTATSRDLYGIYTKLKLKDSGNLLKYIDKYEEYCNIIT